MPFTEQEKRERKKIASKKYKEKNKKKLKKYNDKYNKKYKQTPQGKKSERITKWKKRGIICDYQHYYDIYLQQHKCYYCRKQFKNTYDRCLDHNHNITDDYNVRGILCRSCNVKDVYLT